MSWSNKYIQIPFIEKGRDFNGCDCWGLVRLVYEQELNIDLPSFLEYENTKDIRAISRMIRENQFGDSWFKVTDPLPFDVLVFRMMGSVAHVGIVVKNGLMLHCQKNVNTAHEAYLLKSSDWVERLEGIYRHAKYSDRGITV